MAQRVHVHLIDDLDGTSAAEETVTFGLDRVQYEIDLSSEHARNLRDCLESFVTAARRTSGRVKRSGGQLASPASAGSGSSREMNQTIREWARTNGHELAERGRIPAHIVAEFEAAQAKRKK